MCCHVYRRVHHYNKYKRRGVVFVTRPEIEYLLRPVDAASLPVKKFKSSHLPNIVFIATATVRKLTDLITSTVIVLP